MGRWPVRDWVAARDFLIRRQSESIVATPPLAWVVHVGKVKTTAHGTPEAGEGCTTLAAPRTQWLPGANVVLWMQTGAEFRQAFRQYQSYAAS